MIKEKRERRNDIDYPFGCKKYIRYEKEDWPSKIHYHDYMELVYGLTGECTCILGNRKFTVREGDLLLIANDEPHEVGIHDSWTSYIIIKFLPEMLISWSQTAPEYSTVFSLLKNINELQRFFSKSETAHCNFDFLCKSALNEWNNGVIGYDMCVRARILEIFMQLIRIWDTKNSSIIKRTVKSDVSDLIQAAITFIEHNFADINRDKCAHAIGLSPSYLSKIFTKELNITFADFVNSVKLNEAEKLLLTTDKSITDISFLSGFTSTAYFISLFRKKHNITPAKYRESAKI